MDKEHERLDRRRFLKYSAVAAAGTVLVACGSAGTTSKGGTGTATAVTSGGKKTGPTPAAATPTTGAAYNQPQASATVLTYKGKYSEAPSLAALAKQGKLDPVEKRLPQNPYVVPHEWITKGKYGGTMTQGYSDTSDWGTTHYEQESMYGHSILRYRHDALEIGPGLAESWEPNEDQSEWTFHFRKGLRWSDGQPFTVDDIIYWWEDEVLYKPFKQSIPDDMRSGKDTVGKMQKVDDYTLKLVFDAPAPATPERLAAWVNRGIGPAWISPKHYMKQFHPKYNPAVKKNKNWQDTYWAKWDFATNPDNPVLTGYRLKQYKKGQYSIWERNPYYWCIDRWGQQLPYIDQVIIYNVQDPEVLKLQYTQGKFDYVHGGFAPIAPNDYGLLIGAKKKGNYNLLFWDSGSGTGSMFFFNHDYPDHEIRTLFRNPKFKQALSYAYDRATVRKTIYYNTGELTTGTLSPKGKNFHIGKGPQVYTQWRDSYIKYDPERAKQMLDELGLKDTNGDGFRELPSGRKLKITLDYHSDTARENVQKDELLAKNWSAVGINTVPNPITSVTFDTKWQGGQLMTNTDWEVGDNAPLIYPGWVIPVEPAHWAPLEGQWWTLKGTGSNQKELDVSPWKRHPPRMGPPDKEFFPVVQKLWNLYNKARLETDEMKRTAYLWEVFKIHMNDGPMFIGEVANWLRSVIVRNGLKNVPTRDDLALHGWVNPWIHPTPAAYDPEAYYWDNPEQHTS